MTILGSFVNDTFERVFHRSTRYVILSKTPRPSALTYLISCSNVPHFFAEILMDLLSQLGAVINTRSATRGPFMDIGH